MTPKGKALYALFRGRSNVPSAAKQYGLTAEQMKREFREYVKQTPMDDWELDIVLCWPYA